MVELDVRQRQRERALLLAAVLDGMIGLPLLIAGLTSNSLTCFGECLRGYMMWAIDLATLVVIRQLHRGRLTGFDFGTGKIEQLWSVAIACGLAVAAGWVAYDAVMLVAAGETTASPLGLCLAAVVGALNIFVNFVAFDKVRVAARGRPSGIMDAQVQTRRARLFASLVVQASMTGAALALDPLIVAWLDAAGALLVSVIMCRAAMALLWDAIPDLLDRSARQLAGSALVEASHALPAGFSLASWRSRGTARALRLEVVVGCSDSESIAALRAARAVLAAELERLLPGTEINLTLDTP